MSEEWMKEAPIEQGWYWHWSGYGDDAPFILSIMWSGTTNSCFVSIGNPGIEYATDCDEYGGWWMRIPEPTNLPRAITNS